LASHLPIDLVIRQFFANKVLYMYLSGPTGPVGPTIHCTIPGMVPIPDYTGNSGEINIALVLVVLGPDDTRYCYVCCSRTRYTMYH